MLNKKKEKTRQIKKIIYKKKRPYIFGTDWAISHYKKMSN